MHGPDVLAVGAADSTPGQQPETDPDVGCCDRALSARVLSRSHTTPDPRAPAGNRGGCASGCGCCCATRRARGSSTSTTATSPRSRWPRSWAPSSCCRRGCRPTVFCPAAHDKDCMNIHMHLHVFGWVCTSTLSHPSTHPSVCAHLSCRPRRQGRAETWRLCPDAPRLSGNQARAGGRVVTLLAGRRGLSAPGRRR